MFALVKCPVCEKLRIIDKDTLTSKCPFCGRESENRYLHILYEDHDQKAVREALEHMYGFKPETKDMSKIKEADPLSTLIYEYEKCGTVECKMELLASGLSKIYGMFTLENMKEVDPKNAEKLLTVMLDECFVFEAKPGFYKA